MERTMGRARRWTTGAVVAAGLVLSAGLAAAAGETLHGTALVEAKDTSRGTVTLAGHTYRVTSQTRLLGRTGDAITLRDLHAGATREGVVSEATADAVEYELQPQSEVLDSLRVVDMMPR